MKIIKRKYLQYIIDTIGTSDIKVIARTKHDDYQYDGIQIIDIANWLSRDN